MANTTGMTTTNDTTTNQGTVLMAGRTQVLPGRPLFTIATLITAASMLVTSIAGAALIFVGALPDEQAQLAAHITPWLGVAGAAALGLGALGKGVYALAAALDRGSPLPEIAIEQEGQGAGADRVTTQS